MQDNNAFHIIANGVLPIDVEEKSLINPEFCMSLESNTIKNISDKNNSGWNCLHLICRYYQRKNLFNIIELLQTECVLFNIYSQEIFWYINIE